MTRFSLSVSPFSYPIGSRMLIELTKPIDPPLALHPFA